MPKMMKDPNTGAVLLIADYSVDKFRSCGYIEVAEAAEEKPKRTRRKKAEAPDTEE